MLADWQTFNPVYGTTGNPWDATLVPGGSSGGAGAALAAGLTGLELGSDIGASIRNPAHYCGVFGHKPTFGLCPIQGHNLPANLSTRDMMVIGPLARSAEDLEIALGIIGQPDEMASRGVKIALAKPKPSMKKLKIAVLANAANAEVDQSVQAAVLAAAKCFADNGATVSDTARPDIDLYEPTIPSSTWCAARPSTALTDEQFQSQQAHAAKLAPGDDNYLAWLMRANTMSHRDWHGWNEKREQMRVKWSEFFRGWDLLLCPAAATAAFPHNHKGERWERMVMVNGRPQPSTTQMFWAGYPGLAWLPSSVAPAGCTEQRLPVGVQIVGPQYATSRPRRAISERIQPFVARAGILGRYGDGGSRASACP